MDTANWIFLTPSQVVDAFAYDFEQYGTQPGLYPKLVNRIPGMGCDLIFKDDRPFFRVIRDGDGPDLDVPIEKMGFFLIHLLESVPLSLETLTAMASLVFRAETVCGGSKGRDGIWVEHGMERFSCVRCGHCCRDLAYANDCTREDVLRWQQAGRRDILGRVREIEEGRFEIWVNPETGIFYDTCPWLAFRPDTRHHLCTIYEFRPDTCRQYPLTPKHAAMTGCRGKFPDQTV